MIEFTEDRYIGFIKSPEDSYNVYRKEIMNDLIVSIDLWKSKYLIEIDAKLILETRDFYRVILNSRNTIPLAENYTLPFELVKTVFNATISEFKSEIEKLKTSILINLN